MCVDGRNKITFSLCIHFRVRYIPPLTLRLRVVICSRFVSVLFSFLRFLFFINFFFSFRASSLYLFLSIYLFLSSSVFFFLKCFKRYKKKKKQQHTTHIHTHVSMHNVMMRPSRFLYLRITSVKETWMKTKEEGGGGGGMRRRSWELN